MATQEHTFSQGCFNVFTKHYEGFIIILPPIIFLPVMLITNDTANRCIYVVLIMATYWITEVIPLGVTSMIPIILFPVFDILPADKLCMLFFKDTLIMFLTSIMVATAIEYSGLHIRIALRVLQFVGCSPRRLHFGIVLTTSLLSIWISNSACTAMMLPILKAVLNELESQGLVQQYMEEDKDLPKEEKRASGLATCFYLSVAYASSIGGVGSLIGTPTNLTFKGIYENDFPDSEERLDFGIFLVYALPVVAMGSTLMYIAMEFAFMGLFRPNSADAKNASVGKEGEEIGMRVINSKYDEIGPTKTEEILTATLFVILILLYIFQDPGFVTGWIDLFKSKGIKNSCPTAVILIIIFTLPGNFKFLKFWSNDSMVTTSPLLTWPFITERVPWGLIFLVGGGAVLSQGSTVSGMAKKLGEMLSVLGFLPPPALLFVVIFAAVFLTNFSANVAVANILIPVLGNMALELEIHPLYLVLPVGLACSMPFLLPAGTPPNAMVQSYGNIHITAMFKGGFYVSVTTIFTIWILAQTWGFIIYPNTNTFPEWARNTTEEKKSEDDLMDLWDLL